MRAHRELLLCAAIAANGIAMFLDEGSVARYVLQGIATVLIVAMFVTTPRETCVAVRIPLALAAAAVVLIAVLELVLGIPRAGQVGLLGLLCVLGTAFVVTSLMHFLRGIGGPASAETKRGYRSTPGNPALFIDVSNLEMCDEEQLPRAMAGTAAMSVECGPADWFIQQTD
jgi:hypothetical protein